MNKEKIGYQNINETQNVLWDKKLREFGARWVQSDEFWLFGTLTFFEQRKGIVFEDERQRQLRFLFNALDRELLPRKLTHTDLKKDTKLKEGYHKRQDRERHKAKYRLERVVYDELGRDRNLSHAHFFIKGTTKNWRLKGIQEELIKTTITELWQNHYTRFGTLEIKTHNNSKRIAGYGYKEEANDIKRLRRSKRKDTENKTITGSFNSTCSFLLM